MSEIIFPSEVFKHPNRDFTWEMNECDIEDKIKEQEINKKIKNRGKK